MAQQSNPSSQFRIRPAKKDDSSAMTDVFFHSFNAKFFQYFIPDTTWNREWWDAAWALSIDNPTDRNFVIEDTAHGDRIVAFSRWMLPQSDGNQERKWPDMDESKWDMDLAGAFFGGMEESRKTLMGKRPHWCEYYLPFLPFFLFLLCFSFPLRDSNNNILIYTYTPSSPRTSRRPRRLSKTRHRRKSHEMGY